MDRIDIKEYAILLMLFGAMLGLVPMCFYVKSSYLLGAFLAGIMLCTYHTIHHVWDKQMTRIMFWMLRIFFACTIGFAVPIKDFMTDLKIVTDALIYFVAVIGKVATGIFATGRPITIHEFCMISFAMGEFAFILGMNDTKCFCLGMNDTKCFCFCPLIYIATQAYGAGIITKNTMTSILMAVLFSVIIAPLLLYADLNIMKKKQEQYLIGKRKETMMSIQTSFDERRQRTSIIQSVSGRDGDTSHAIVGSIHSVYYCIHTKTMGHWGHQNQLLKSLYKLK
ncbi:MAG: hypothetical protein GY755_02160, partial [Chloroflexi bacterium]|nr:hypothetical protein [Chloroflexota bacterium]